MFNETLRSRLVQPVNLKKIYWNPSPWFVVQNLFIIKLKSQYKKLLLQIEARYTWSLERRSINNLKQILTDLWNIHTDQICLLKKSQEMPFPSKTECRTQSSLTIWLTDLGCTSVVNLSMVWGETCRRWKLCISGRLSSTSTAINFFELAHIYTGANGS